MLLYLPEELPGIPGASEPHPTWLLLPLPWGPAGLLLCLQHSPTPHIYQPTPPSLFFLMPHFLHGDLPWPLYVNITAPPSP